MTAERISVVIPTLDEESGITAVLKRAATGQDVELIVVDGGSTDRTMDLARGAGAKDWAPDRRP